MSSNTDIIELLSSEADVAIDQIIEDSKRLHIVVNGTGTEQATTEDGSLIPSVRKALIDNLYFKTPPLPWRAGSPVTVFNQLYAFSDVNGNVTWWYAPGATTSNPVTMQSDPYNDNKFRVFLDKTNIADIYAPIMSPDFKGNPRVPTPAEGDASTTIPNTTWVKNAITKAIEGTLPNWQDGVFENITVHNNSILHNIRADGDITFLGTKVDAVDSEFNLKKINLVGPDAEINFLWSAGAGYRTNLTPGKIFSTEITGNKVNSDLITAGTDRSTSLTVRGNGVAQFDTVSIRQNDRQDPTQDTLNVQGITRLNNLIVEGTTVGINANVDGQDIAPNSVTSTITTTGSLGVTGDAQVGGNSTFIGDVEFLGKVKGLDTSNIEFDELTLDNMTVHDQLVVEGGATLATARIGDVVFTGTVAGIVMPPSNVDGMEIKPASVETPLVKADDVLVNKAITTKDLHVTGVVTGIDTTTGADLKPATIVTTGDVTVGGLLTLNGQVQVNNIDGQLVKTKTLEVTETATIENLTVPSTGTITGFGGVVNDEDITPNSVAITEGLSVGGTTTLRNLNVTGTVTGLNPDFGPDSSLVAGTVSATTVSADSVIAGNTTTGNITVTGRILDANGDDFALQVSPTQIGDAIKQISIQPQTITTKVSDTNKGFVTTGTITADNGSVGTLTTNDITLQNGTVNGSLKVMGEILDKDGNPVAIMDIPSMIAGKDINPKNVVASGNITTTGELKGGKTTVGALEAGNTKVGTLNTTGSAGIVGALTVSETANFAKNLIVGQALTVTGQSTLGNVVVGGTLTDAQGNPIGSAESIAGKDIAPRNVTASGPISTTLALTGKSGGVTEAWSAGSLSTGGDLTAGKSTLGVTKTTSLETGLVKATGITMATGSITVSAGGLSLNKTATIGENLTVYENTTLGHVDMNFDGDRLTVVGNQRVNGNLYVTGNINGNVDISGQDINPRGITATGNVSVAGTTTSDIGDFNSLEVGVSGAATGLRVLNSATIAGNLTVTGSVNAVINQSQQDVVTKSLNTGNITATAVTTGTAKVNTSLDASTATISAKSVTADKFLVKPKVVTTSTGSYVPDGTTNVYDVTLAQNTRIEAPSGLITGGLSGSIILYLNQDATGGREVTFGTEFSPLNDGAVNMNPNGVTVVQLMYSGHGSVIDTLILPRT